ncbi:hypothetical protein BC834DRAFT_898546 [Gloeopeniophorella convolvens]|nr:hypothetical protein BC834DRAFT_898546 [Gloeopeniophorella convolvens]
MRDLFISLHPELPVPFRFRRDPASPNRMQLPDMLLILPSCPDPACHTAQMQLPNTHDPQPHPWPDNPPSLFASNATPPPSDAHAVPCSQPAGPSASPPSTPREPYATLFAGPASPGYGASAVDSSTPSHGPDDVPEPSRSSSPIVSFTDRHDEASAASLVHGSQGSAELASVLDPSP